MAGSSSASTKSPGNFIWFLTSDSGGRPNYESEFQIPLTRQG
jgi:hypothetical protein